MSSPSKQHPGSHPQGGFALLESMIAILIFSIGILAIMVLQAASIQNSTDAKYRSDASVLANQIIGQMWADSKNLASYAGTSYATRKNWDTQVAATLPNGTSTIRILADTSGNNTIAEVTVSWQPPSASLAHSYVTKAQIQANP